MLRYAVIFSFYLACMLFSSCTKVQDEHTVRFHEDGRKKPYVAILPVIDQSGAKIGWSLSDEFTDSLTQSLLKKNNFCLASLEDPNQITTTLHEKQNLFDMNPLWMQKTLTPYEFVVFTELIEHDIHPKPLKNRLWDKITPSCELSLSMRIRIFDLRHSEPTTILQEIVHQSHLIPKPSALHEQQPEKWKSMTFTVSAIGLAHSQLAKEIATRIDEYILLAKSR